MPHDIQRELTVPIRNGPAARHRVQLPAGEDGSPPPDVFIRVVNGHVVRVWEDVHALGQVGWTAYVSQRAPGGGWELVRAPSLGGFPSSN